MTSITNITGIPHGVPLPAIAGTALLALALLGLMAYGVRRLFAKFQAVDILTFTVAGMATVASGQGMWKFFGDSLDVKQVYLRTLMFSMYEAAMLVCALRTRNRIKKGIPVGLVGPAVWIMAAISGVLATTDVETLGGGLARLVSPLVAAFLWELGLSEERLAAGKSQVKWRFIERILARFGLTGGQGRSVSDVDARRRIAQLARAEVRLRVLKSTGAKPWRVRRATRLVIKRMEAAVEHAELASNPPRQVALLAQIGALGNATELASMTLPAPWDESVRLHMEPVGPARTDDHADDSTETSARTGIHTEPRTEPSGPVRHPHTDSTRRPAETSTRLVRTDRPRALEPVRSLPAGGEPADRTKDSDAARRPAGGTGETIQVDRDKLVQDLTAEIRETVNAGEKWSPDYADLQARTRRGRSWCEKVVADAKRAVFPTHDDEGTAQLLGLRTPPLVDPVDGDDLSAASGT